MVGSFVKNRLILLRNMKSGSQRIVFLVHNVNYFQSQTEGLLPFTVLTR